MPIHDLRGNPVDFEDRIENEIDRAAAAARAGDKCLWIAGLHVARILGKYKVNAVKDIALKAGRHESSVENWAHAVWLLNDLRKSGFASDVKTLRKMLTPTHFWRMWDLRNKYGLRPKKVMHYFSMILQHKLNGHPASASAMAQEVEAGETKNGTAATWSYLKKGFQRVYVNVLVAPDTPRNVRRWLRKAPQSVKESTNGQANRI
jgi:hypothetical protein